MINQLFAAVHFDGSVWKLSFADIEGRRTKQAKRYPSGSRGRKSLATHIKEEFLASRLSGNRVVLVTNYLSESNQLYWELVNKGLKTIPVTQQRLALHADRIGTRDNDLVQFASNAAATGFDADLMLIELTNICTFRCLYCT